MVDLKDSREKIDKIDHQIVELFEQRMKIASDVADYKIQTGKKVLDKERENQKLEHLSALASNPFNKHAVNELFSQIMSMSRKWQYSKMASNTPTEFVPFEHLDINQDTKVAYFGEPGSNTEQAMLEYFGKEVDGQGVGSFKTIMEMVKDGTVEYGVLPIENSSTGGITDIFDLLFEYGNTIIGEHCVKIEHVLLAKEGTTLADVKEVYSHPQGILQCRSFFENMDEVTLKEFESTSAAAKYASEHPGKEVAAIASVRAGQYYGLTPIATSISTENKNYTRFIIITNKKWFHKDANKVSICFEIPHESGSLYNMLSHIIYNGLNMTKIESRPIRGRTWEYRFFVEFEGNLKDAGVKNALVGIHQEASDFKIIGNFRTI